MLQIVFSLKGFELGRIRIGRHLASYSKICGFGCRLGDQQSRLLSVTAGKFRHITSDLPFHDTNFLAIGRCLVYLLIAFK